MICYDMIWYDMTNKNSVICYEIVWYGRGIESIVWHLMPSYDIPSLCYDMVFVLKVMLVMTEVTERRI